MNSTKVKRKLLQKSKPLPLRNDSKLKKYNSRKEQAPTKVINKIIQIKRKRFKYIEGYKTSPAFGDSDSVKSSHSQDSVIYVGTKYPGLNNNKISVVDLTKSDSEMALSRRKKLKKNGVVKSITTIQSVNNLACTSSENIGLIIQNLNNNNEAAKSTKSTIQLRRTYPCTSMPEPEKSLVPVIDGHVAFLEDVSTLISGDLGQISTIERMVYEMDIDTIVELYKIDRLDQFDGFDI